MEKILDLVDVLRSVEIPEDHQTDATVGSVRIADARPDLPAKQNDPGGPRDATSISENAPDWREGTFVTPRVVG
jgi:Asp-tRNA(Asn)/Glu-tRNA(Gln) amidotransferase C subunit